MDRLIHQKLLDWKWRSDRKPLILRGARQVGKTFALKEFGNAHFPTAHYLNFEKESRLGKIFEPDLSPKRILSEIGFHLGRPVALETDLLILDEIQTCPAALTSLKYFAEEIPQLAICGAGSLLGLTLGTESFPVGKVDFLDMSPMTFEEFLLASSDKKSIEILQAAQETRKIPEIAHVHLWDKLKHYFVIGGLPEIVKLYSEGQEDLFQTMNLAREKQDALVTAYLADMAKHSGQQNAMDIERLWKNIPAQLAKNQDGSVSRYQFKGVIPGKNQYSRLKGIIDWLEATGLLIKVFICNAAQLPLSAYTKENIFKLYFFDIGLLGALSGLHPKTILDYGYGTYKGYFAENFVAQEFVAAGVKQLYAWNEGTAEIEFVREWKGQLFPVEVKAGNSTKAKSLKVFAMKYHPLYSTVMSLRNLEINSEKLMHCYPLYLAGRFPFFPSHLPSH